MPFDIASLRAFAPPRFQCEKCLALLRRQRPLPDQSQRATSVKCSICHVVYLPTDEYPIDIVEKYLDRHGPSCLNTKDAFTHAEELAEIAQRIRDQQRQSNSQDTYTPLRGLLKALSIARKFVHFTTYGGIPHLLIGALKITAQRVHVRGIVSGAKGEVLSENTVSELTNYHEEAPEMCVKIYDPSLAGWATMPHQKLIVIDGLLAFKGSANLTLAGGKPRMAAMSWRSSLRLTRLWTSITASSHPYGLN
jgi:phosphatidylserine/phosphatidylglycerophosphate/cardiolipin synthase-like enzyme